MEYRTIEWDREKLYNEIWEKPAVQLAKEYGVSDVAVAKICRKLKIPKPGVGYWRRKERGFKVARAPLPAMKDVPRLTSHVAIPGSESPQERLSPDLQALAEVERTPERRITVAPDLSRLHPLAEKALRMLRNGKGTDGFIRPRQDSIVLAVAVSVSAIDRAVLIMDALLNAFESRGHSVLIEREPQLRTVAVVDGEHLAFSLVEKIKRQTKEPTAAEVRDRQKNPYRYYQTEYTYSPTGILTLQVHDTEVFGVRTQWKDGKRQKLETILNDIVFDFVRCAAAKRDRRIELARREAEEREWQRIRWQKAEEIRKEEEKLKDLEGEIENWQRSQRIRSYIDAVRASFAAAGKEIAKESELGRWIDWALAHADRFDPLKMSPPSILDEKRKYRL